MTYGQKMDYALDMYTTDDVIAGAYNDILRFL